jgi:hypothetical protein
MGRATGWPVETHKFNELPFSLPTPYMVLYLLTCPVASVRRVAASDSPTCWVQSGEMSLASSRLIADRISATDVYRCALSCCIERRTIASRYA